MGFFKKGELAFLWPFYLESFLSALLLFFPVFLIIYFVHLNFSLFQIGLLMAMTPLAALIFEVPTGAVADLYGRKFSVLLSLALSFIGYILLMFFTNFLILLVIFAFLGFASTFYSGAREAWAVDLMKKGNLHLSRDYFTKIQGLNSAGLFISGLLGAFLVKLWGVSIIWPATAMSYLFAFLVLAIAKEYSLRKKVYAKKALHHIKKQTTVSMKYSFRHPVIFYFLMAGAIFSFAMTLNVSLSWIPFMKELGMPDYAFGYMWSAMSAIGVLSMVASNKLLKRGRERIFILNSILLVALSCILVIFVRNLFFAWIILLTGNFFCMIQYPAERIYFHRFIPSKLRATIGSVEGMISAIMGIISLLIAGKLVDTIGPSYTIFIAGIIMIPAAIIFYRIKE